MEAVDWDDWGWLDEADMDTGEQREAKIWLGILEGVRISRQAEEKEQA